MPGCRSPPFLPENSQSKETEDFKMKKGFYLYVNRQKVKVSEEIYKVYCGKEIMKSI